MSEQGTETEEGAPLHRRRRPARGQRASPAAVLEDVKDVEQRATRRRGQNAVGRFAATPSSKAA